MCLESGMDHPNATEGLRQFTSTYRRSTLSTQIRSICSMGVRSTGPESIMPPRIGASNQGTQAPCALSDLHTKHTHSSKDTEGVQQASTRKPSYTYESDDKCRERKQSCMCVVRRICMNKGGAKLDQRCCFRGILYEIGQLSVQFHECTDFSDTLGETFKPW